MNMKKFASLVLAMVMLFSLSMTAFAAMEGTLTGGSITINDAVSGQTYNAYQILYLESYNEEAGAYAYKANSAWEDWLRTQTSYVAFDAQGYVTWVDGADVEAFAKLAQAQAKNMTADATQTTTATDPASTVAVTFSGLKLGYYLVDTTLGTLCSLDTTQPNVEMFEKNEAPTAEKKVQEDSDSSWGDNNDADYKQQVKFAVTIEAKKGAQNYILHDKMSDGLTFNNDV